MGLTDSGIIKTVLDNECASGPQFRDHGRAKGVQNASFAGEARDGVVPRPVLLDRNDLFRRVDLAVAGTICTDVGAERLRRGKCHPAGVG